MATILDTKKMQAAFKSADPQLDVDFIDAYDPHEPSILIGCKGTVTDPATQDALVIDTAWRPRDEHQMAAIRTKFHDPNSANYGVMVPKKAKFIAEHAVHILTRHQQQLADDHATESDA